MNKVKKLNQIRKRRKTRIRARIKGTADKPRLSIFKSNRYIYIQLIDDVAGKTLVSVSAGNLKKAAVKIGKAIAEKAIAKGIKKVVFDRGRYKYHGQIKDIADAARDGGLVI